MRTKIHALKLVLALLISCTAFVSCSKDDTPDLVKEKIKFEQAKMNTTSANIENLGMDLWYSENGPPYILVSCEYSGIANQLDVAISCNGSTDHGTMWTSGGTTLAYFQLAAGSVPTSRYTVSVQVDDNMGNTGTTSINVYPPPDGTGTVLKGSLSEMRCNLMKEEGWPNFLRYYFRFTWGYNSSNYLYRDETVYVGMKFYDSQGYFVGAITGSGQPNSVSFMDVSIPTNIVEQAGYVKFLAGSSYDAIDPFTYNERWENHQILTSISFGSFDSDNVSMSFSNKTIPVN